MTVRIPKTAIVVAIVLAILILTVAIVANRYRDSIALEVANAALGDSDMAVTDVSVDSIRADQVRFAEILLQLASGTVILVEDVTLPVSFRGLRGSSLHIGTVTVLPTAGETAPLRLAAALRAYLDVPASMPGASVEVDELVLPDMPAIRDLAWYADELNPTLRAGIGSLDVYITTTPSSEGVHRASIRALTEGDVEAIMVGLRILPAGDGFELRGKSVLRLEPLLPVLRSVGAVPEALTALASTLNGTFETRLEGNETLPILMDAQIEIDELLELSYQASGEAPVQVTVTDAATLAASFEYPALDWAMDIQEAGLLFSGAGFDALPVTLRDASCRSGVHCETAFDAAVSELDIGGLSIGRLSLSADSVRIVSRDGDWKAASSDSLIALHEPSFAGWRFVAPTIVAGIDASNDKLTASLQVSTPEGGFAARAELLHDLVSGAGDLQLSDVDLDFGILNLSEAFDQWPYEWDVTSGHWAVDGNVNWTVAESGLSYGGTAVHAADSLAGKYGDIGFVGLHTGVETTLSSGASPSLSPVSLEVELIDIGFPIEDIRSRFTLDIDTRSANIESLSMALLGGEVTADPFLYRFDETSNTLLLRANRIQLPLMVALADLDAVEISGSVSGEMPVSVIDGQIVVDKGHLENDAPGGTISYGSDDQAGLVDDDSQLGIVARTLRNFEYDVLTSEVNYTKDGDLKLQMRLTGVSPDVDATQPVILNLDIENNVPQMLRSLQATRSIEDILERQLSR